MSSVLIWWQERLIAKFPVSDKYKITPYNYKMRDGVNVDTWPGRIARQALYTDYSAWFEEGNRRAWPGTEPDDPRWSKPATELVFYSTMAPLLYVHDKTKMVKNYWVKKQVPFEGSFQTIKVRRWFIRLGTWEEHVAVYERETGKTLNLPASSEKLVLT